MIVSPQKKGPLKSANLNYNAEGKSKGVANVVFNRPGDAARAVKEYNNRTFDGRPMRLELVVSADVVTAVPATSRLGAPVNKGGNSKQGQQQQQQQKGGRGQQQGQQRGGNRGGRRGGRGGKRGPSSKPKTAEELDAELEGYMNDEVFFFCCGMWSFL
jgi:THO complex subunit 4